MTPLRVLQLVDALRSGGAERMAVNIANHLPQDQFESYLATTVNTGLYQPLIMPHVRQFHTSGKLFIDPRTLGWLVNLIKREQISLLHVHGIDLFMAVQAATLLPRLPVIWHDHYGRQDTRQRPVWAYFLATRRVDGILSVSQPLRDWAIQTIAFPANRVTYLSNFIFPGNHPSIDEQSLPGQRPYRMACVANLRPQKDHLTLLSAMRLVVNQCPQAHLILMGEMRDASYAQTIREMISRLNLGANVSFLGTRPDVPEILEASDIGVLSSSSEGLPLALIEYGMAKLGVVCTSVGECPRVLREGQLGLLVPPSDPQALAAALIDLLSHPEKRQQLGNDLAEIVQREYSPEARIAQLVDFYYKILAYRDKRGGKRVKTR